MPCVERASACRWLFAVLIVALQCATVSPTLPARPAAALGPVPSQAGSVAAFVESMVRDYSSAPPKGSSGGGGRSRSGSGSGSKGPKSPRDVARQVREVYLTQKRKITCCRQCSDRHRPRPAIVKVAMNPTQYFPCCPFCPLPPITKRKGKMPPLGPWKYYFNPPPKQNQGDKYMAELAKGVDHHPEPPGSMHYMDPDLYHSNMLREFKASEAYERQIEEELSQAQANTGGAKGFFFLDVRDLIRLGNSPHDMERFTTSKAHHVDPRSGFVELASRTKARSQDPFEAMPDPYEAMRGMQMDRWANYMYGFPPEPQTPERGDVPESRAQSVPPCCNVCTRRTSTISVGFETGCCVQCAITYAGHPPWRTARERFDDEQDAKEKEKQVWAVD